MARETNTEKKNRAIEIYKILNETYVDATCSLDYENALQLLIATQLAAQCTDKRVNIVTPKLFKQYKNVYEYANADIKELEVAIRSTGFYHNKAKNIKACCQMLIEEHGGEVPDNMEQLSKLPGVGRKTANVILGEIFKKPAVIVDTHAKRLSNRLGLTSNQDPVKIEFDLQKILPEEVLTKFSHLLVSHGRQCCKAQKPACEECVVKGLCVYCSKAQNDVRKNNESEGKKNNK